MASVLKPVSRAASAPGRLLENSGKQVWFYGRAYGWTYRAILRYKKEVMRLLAGISLGTGALALVGGTVMVVTFIAASIGIEVGLLGYKQLNDIGVGALSGFVSAYVNTREAAPLVAGVALVATVGAGFTAELGAMRVSEEIDALESMGVPSIPYLVTTRIVAGLIAITPLYSVSLIMTFACTRLLVTIFNNQAVGTYQHYFNAFLIPSDLLISLVKVVIMSLVVMSVHCYYGFTATGGPVGVGVAVGRAVRLSLISVMVVDLLLSMALYGNSNTLHISG